MTYEYVCMACGNEWEAEQSISAPPLKDCPQCHASSAKRQVSGGAGFILKGGGWYADGYGSSGKKPDATKTESPASSGSSSSNGASSSSTSDTKTDTSTPKKTETPSGTKGSTTAAA